MVQHVISGSVYHARLDDGVIVPRLANNFLGGPLRVRPTMGSCAPKAKQDNLRDPSLLGGLDDVTGSFNVDTPVRLSTHFAVNACTMRHCTTRGECACQLRDAAQIGRTKRCIRQIEDAPVAMVQPSRNYDNLRSASDESADQMTPTNPVPPVIATLRRQLLSRAQRREPKASTPRDRKE
jgi:hypothetical protein